MTTRTIEDYETVEPDWYDAVVRDLEESTTDGPFGPYIEWTFGALTDDGEVEVTGRTGDKWKGNTKARAWYSAIVGRPLASGEDVDFDTIIGAPCRINVTVVTSDKGISYNRIVDVAPRKAKARPGSAQAMLDRLADADEPPYPTDADLSA